MNSLLVKLEDIPDEGLALELDVSIADMAAILEDGENTPAVLSPLRGDLFLRKAEQDRLSIKGVFRVTTEIICDRCLADTPTELKGSVNELLNLIAPGAEAPDDDEADGDLELRYGKIDLSGLLGEWFWVVWPMNFICRPDCAGLCPRCGADLNDGLCECAGADEN